MRTIPIPTLTEKDRARFLAKLAPADGNGCRLWTAAKLPNGYGSFRVGAKVFYPHRLAYTLFVGQIPEGLEIDHFTCFNHACCAPEHLRPTTRKQNGENRLGAQVGSHTGVRGVYEETRNGRTRWIAKFIHNDRSVWLGRFDTIADAEAAVIAGRLSLFTHNEVDRRTQ